MYRLPGSRAFTVHSRTLPAMSYTPRGLTLRLSPPRTGPVASYRPCGTTHRAASGIAAAFHSSTVGSSLCTNRAYARASYQLTPPTGRSRRPRGGAPPSHDEGPG